MGALSIAFQIKHDEERQLQKMKNETQEKYNKLNLEDKLGEKGTKLLEKLHRIDEGLNECAKWFNQKW